MAGTAQAPAFGTSAIWISVASMLEIVAETVEGIKFILRRRDLQYQQEIMLEMEIKKHQMKLKIEEQMARRLDNA